MSNMLIHRIHSFVLLVDEDVLWLEGVGGTEVLGGGICPNTPSLMTNITQTDLGSNPSVHHEAKTNNYLKQSTAFED
jgi:hypothetical protein